MRRLAIFNEEQIEAEALRLFRLMHGSGDAGDPSEYWCQNPSSIDGWERIAVEMLTLKTRCENESDRMHAKVPTRKRGAKMSALCAHCGLSHGAHCHEVGRKFHACRVEDGWHPVWRFTPEPFTPKLPEQEWRELGPDEVIQDGDEISGNGAQWSPVKKFRIGSHVRRMGPFRFRRRVEPQPANAAGEVGCVAVDKRRWWERKLDRLFPSRHVEFNDALTATFGAGDVINTQVVCDLSAADRLRLLITGKLVVTTRTYTQHSVGLTHSDSVCHVAWRAK